MPKRSGEGQPAAPPSLEQWGGEQATAKFAEHQKLARQLNAAKADARAKEEQLRQVNKKLDLYESLGTEPRPVASWLVPAVAKDHHAIPSLVMTDIHMDEEVRPEELEGYNCYNRPIAVQRIQRGFTKAVMLTRNYFAGVVYDGFQLFLAGDNISGGIHEELLETNVGTICESILAVADPLAAGIKLLAEEFGKVNVNCVVGNHGRRTKKPRSKFRAKDNFDWMVYQIISRDLRNVKGVTIHVSESADDPVTLYGTRYRLTHGDQFRGGSGIAAELSPLLLGAHRKVKKQAAKGLPYDVLVMGHWHKSLWLPTSGLIVSGSVIGYNEHADIANFMPEPPQLPLWLTTPEHGITNCAPVFLQDRAAEGW